MFSYSIVLTVRRQVGFEGDLDVPPDAVMTMITEADLIGVSKGIVTAPHISARFHVRLRQRLEGIRSLSEVSTDKKSTDLVRI
jgi:hypothetical protein